MSGQFVVVAAVRRDDGTLTPGYDELTCLVDEREVGVVGDWLVTVLDRARHEFGENVGLELTLTLIPAEVDLTFTLASDVPITQTERLKEERTT